MFAKFRTIFLEIFGTCKNLIVCDGLVYWETCPEIWPKSFKKQRSYDNFKHLVKKRRILFLAPWTSNFRIFFFIFENGSIVHDEGNRMALTPSKSALRFSRSQGGPNRPPPHQLTSSRKPTSNRVKWVPRAPLGSRGTFRSKSKYFSKNVYFRFVNLGPVSWRVQ